MEQICFILGERDMANGNVAFFMGANTKNGFYSLMDTLHDERDIERIYMIKSGPGCGKSAVLRKLGDALEGDGRREDLYCSGDPRSLDGTVLHGIRAALLDGTAPHVHEPDFPGASGDYLPLPPLKNARELREEYPALLALSAAMKAHYAAAYRQIKAAALTEESLRRLLLPLYLENKLTRRAAGILTRELPKKKGAAGILRQRFLDGITPDGRMFMRKSVEALCPRIILLEDRFGFGAQMLEILRDGALARGYEVYACPCPLDPTRLLHLLLPEAGLAFISEDGTRMPDCAPYRRIRVDAYAPAECLRTVRGRVRTLQRLRDGLMEDAIAEIDAAHALHDRVEDIYRPHVDFDAQDGAVAALAARIRIE